MHVENIFDLSNILKKSIESLPSEDNFLKEGYDEKLDEYRNLAKGGKEELSKICIREKEKTGINNLKIKYNKVFGYFFEVSKLNSSKLPEYFIKRQTLVNVDRFITEELKTFETKIIHAQNNFIERQNYLIEKVREKIILKSNKIQKISKLIAEIDNIFGFSVMAEKYECTKPKMLESLKTLTIEEGRHIVVQSSLEKNEKQFIPNNLSMNEDNFFHLITGPNMAGKSTFLRQNALIIYLAHLGSFVPAKNVKLPIFDGLFTRIGSGDSLSAGESTFLVEMQETSSIIRQATENSFVILDEIGRGTSTYDGLSLAWAIMENFHEKKIKTLFATHYHELINLAKNLNNAKNFSARILEDEKNGVIFLHKIFEGGAEKSFGIEVAKLAGLPKTIIQRAENILLDLEKKSINKNILNKQVSLFEENKRVEKKEESKVDNIFKNIDINSITPLEALNLLYKIKKS
jgi:DNA mismatch repair protein MutS